MKCLGCSGEVKEIYFGNMSADLRGVCTVCGGAYLQDQRTVLAKQWCSCKNVPHEQESYFFMDSGAHGWLHNVCGQITQTG